jgi:hypothetical protein
MCVVFNVIDETVFKDVNFSWLFICSAVSVQIQQINVNKKTICYNYNNNKIMLKW